MICIALVTLSLYTYAFVDLSLHQSAKSILGLFIRTFSNSLLFPLVHHLSMKKLVFSTALISSHLFSGPRLFLFQNRIYVNVSSLLSSSEDFLILTWYLNEVLLLHDTIKFLTNPMNDLLVESTLKIRLNLVRKDSKAVLRVWINNFRQNILVILRVGLAPLSEIPYLTMLVWYVDSWLEFYTD